MQVYGVWVHHRKGRPVPQALQKARSQEKKIEVYLSSFRLVADKGKYLEGEKIGGGTQIFAQHRW